MTTLALPPPDELVAAVHAVQDYLDAAYSDATRVAYTADLVAYRRWCQAAGLPPDVEPRAVALFAASMADAGRALASIERAIAALGAAWREAHPDGQRLGADVVLHRTLRGIRRRLGRAQKRARPVTPDELRRMVAAVGRLRALSPARQAHHRALLVLMFAGALRVSEALHLCWADVVVNERGVLLTVRRSKTDQEGVGLDKALPRGSHPDSCPATCLDAWRVAQQPGLVADRQRVFHTTARTAYDLVRRTAQLAGIEDWQRVSTHSLRAGLATIAAQAGKPLDAIMRHTGHRSVAMVMRYIRPADLWRDNAAAGIGL